MSDDKESCLYWIFSVGLNYIFTKIRYSWISHVNLAIWWWRSSKISSSTVLSWSVLVFACHVNDSSTTISEFFFATVVIITKKLTDDLLTISV